MKIEIPNSLLVTLSGQTSRGIKAAEVRESDGHLLFTLTDGSKIDLGSVVGPAGTPGTKGDKGEPGENGYSPSAKVQRTETGAIITITDKNGTSYASVNNGKDGSPGAKGDPGDDYVLTSADKQEIAASVVAGGLEVEVSDETPGGESDILICHISGSGTEASPYACDKTSQEINEAATAGKIVYAIDASKRAFPLVSAKPVAASFAMILTNGNLIGWQIKSSTVAYIARSLQDAADRVTALSEESTDAQYPSAKAVYDALQGAGGPDLSLGLTGAAVGQIAKITAVDADGKPTAWSPVDMPSGGGAWTLIHEQTLTEAAESYTYELNNVRAAALVLVPNAEVDSGWKRVKINNLDVPLSNSKVEAQNGIAFAIDLDAPFKVFGTPQATGKMFGTYGVSGNVVTSLTAGDITGINSIGVATSTLLIAGAKISIYVRE